MLSPRRPLPRRLAAVSRCLSVCQSCRTARERLCVAGRQPDRWCAQHKQRHNHWFQPLSPSPRTRSRPEDFISGPGGRAPHSCHRAKHVHWESAAFQTPPGRRRWKIWARIQPPFAHRELRHPRPWHDALSTQTRMGMRAAGRTSAGRAKLCDARLLISPLV
jgi:hypothetical protein